MTVVGEVADVKEDSPDTPDKEQYYQPIDQWEESLGTLGSPGDPPRGNGGYIAIRTAMEPEQMVNALRATVRAIDPQLALDQVQSMERAVSDSEAPRRFNTALISAFAGAPVLLAALGIYSVIAFSAALRVQEMAIRIALGIAAIRNLETGLQLRRQTRARGLRRGIAGRRGRFANHAVACFRSRPVRSPGPGAGCGLRADAALGRAFLPAHRAASIDPTKALRTD